MMDDGLEPVAMTGRWVGFYRHRWEQLGTYPIVADLSQTGDNLAGEMFDQVTNRSDYFDEFLEVIGENVSVEKRFRLQQMLTRFGKETVRNSRLPDTSDIRGKIKGSRVQFTKTYRGKYEVTWTVHGKEMGSVRRDGHQVHYCGNLDRETMCIEGAWIIRRTGLFGRFLPPKSRGSFELYRKS
jgi:hypothetical protein